jgi:glycine/D-amino acid oxidase-like deaminating enzyme
MAKGIYDLVVIGGGIAGSWVGYLATTLKIKTLLISRDPPERTTTWMSGGILSPHAEELEGDLRRWGLMGIRAYEELVAEVPHPPPRTFGYGVLLPFTDEDPFEPFLLYLENHPDTPRETLPPEELKDLVGFKNRLLGGIFLPRDAYVDPRLALKTLKELFVKGGGEILLEEVLEIKKGPMVKTDKKEVSSRWVIVATGALPPPFPGVRKISGDRGVIVRVAHPDPPPYVLYHHGRRGTTYLIPDRSGIRLGSTSDPGDPRTSVDPVELGDLLLRGGALWKGMKGGEFSEAGVGFRPFFPEHPHPQIVSLDEGAIFFFGGFHRNGILLTPPFAQRIVTTLLGEGKLPSFPG